MDNFADALDQLANKIDNMNNFGGYASPGGG
jgi:hypothetical protein